MIRAIVCDLDDTLVAGGRPATPRVRQALDLCRAASVQVVVATGRSPSVVGPTLRALGLAGPHVFNNGALVLDAADRVIEQTPLDRTLGRTILRRGVASKLAVVLHVGGCPYAPVYPGAPPLVAYVLDRGLAERSTLSAMYAARPIQISVGASDGDGELRLTALCAWIAKRSRVTAAAPGIVDVVAPGVDKGSALVRLLSRLGVASTETAAIGDGENDASLFAAVGTRIAMANAGAELRAQADLVVPCVEEDGAAVAIEHLVAGRVVASARPRAPALLPAVEVANGVGDVRHVVVR
jgi:hypothetical protein